MTELERLGDEQTKHLANRVTLEGPGLNVSREISDAQAAEILSIVLRGAGSRQNASATTLTSRAAMAAVTADESLGEFFRRVSPKRNPDKIVTIAEFLSSAEGKKLFTPEDIIARFKDVGEPAPGNFSRDLRWVRQIAWLAVDPETDGYYVTASGSKAVQNGFPEDVTRATKIKQSRSARRRSSELPQEHDRES